MKTILFSYTQKIQYNTDQVLINNKQIDDFNGTTAESFAYEKAREYYRSYLSNHFENYIILTGSGSSYGIGAIGKKGKIMSGLWESVKTSITEEKLKEFCEKIHFPYPEDGKSGDLEALLSKANIAKEFVKYEVEDCINLIQQRIKEDCSLTLPDNSDHELFLKKITSRKLKYPRVKLFTQLSQSQNRHESLYREVFQAIR
ncbi:hypothetical protein [Paenibacillus solanacearum]|uniref:hypothetical protein n=1 Tax=Paenibacillus solanacearum TaxID=2048548 RepID=UPI001C402AF9|nr:hypothetical protein [Paenibacillus solanacearum]